MNKSKKYTGCFMGGLILALALVGCGKGSLSEQESFSAQESSSSTRENSNTRENHNVSQPDSDNQIFDRVSEAGSGTKETVPPENSDEKTGEGSVGEPAVQGGWFDDSIYINESLDLGCILGEGWSFLSREKMEEIYGLASDTAEYDKQKTYIDTLDMTAISQDSGGSINIVLGDFGVMGTYMQQEDFLNNFLNQALDGGTQALRQLDSYENLEGEIISLNFMDSEYKALHYTAEFGGIIPWYEYQIWHLNGSKYAVITITGSDEDVIRDILDWFDTPANIMVELGER